MGGVPVSDSEKPPGEFDQYRHTQDACRRYANLNWTLSCGLHSLKSRAGGNPRSWRGHHELFKLVLEQLLFSLRHVIGFRHIIASLRSSPGALSSSSN
jgi:hypothetical protein